MQQAQTAAAAGTPYLNINNIEVIYSDVILVLKGLSMVVPKGRIVALLGFLFLPWTTLAWMFVFFRNAGHLDGGYALVLVGLAATFLCPLLVSATPPLPRRAVPTRRVGSAMSASS